MTPSQTSPEPRRSVPRFVANSTAPTRLATPSTPAPQVPSPSWDGTPCWRWTATSCGSTPTVPAAATRSPRRPGPRRRTGSRHAQAAPHEPRLSGERSPALLRQPHGFEGRYGVAVADDAPDPTPLQLENE